MDKKNILERWDITLEELSNVVEENPSLRGMIMGYLAESKARKFFESLPQIKDIRKDDDHDRNKKGDITLLYRGIEIRVEVKALQTNSIRCLGDSKFKGVAQCDASDRRKIKIGSDEVETTCLKVGEFDILAVCIFGFTGKWDFAFALNRDLPRSTYKKYPPKIQRQLIKSLVPITMPLAAPFVSDPIVLLNQILKDLRR